MAFSTLDLNDVAQPTPSYTPLFKAAPVPATSAPFSSQAPPVNVQQPFQIPFANNNDMSFYGGAKSLAVPVIDAAARNFPITAGVIKAGAASIPAAVEGFNNTPVAPKVALPPLPAPVEGAFPVASTVARAGMAAYPGMIKAFNDAFDSGASGIKKNSDIIHDYHSSLFQQGAALGDAGLEIVNTVLGAASSPLQGLAKVPGVGYIVDGVNKVLGAMGAGGGAGAVSALNQLPISDGTKKTLEPVVRDAGALAAQFVAGDIAHGATKGAIVKLSDHVSAILQKVKEDPNIQETLAKQDVSAEKPTPSFTPLQIAGPAEHSLLENPETPKLLAAPAEGSPVRGEGFTMTDKADAQKVASQKIANAYQTALDKHTQDPTPKTLAAVLKARDALKADLEVPLAPEPTPTPETPAPTSGNAVTGNGGVVDERPIVNGQRVTKAAAEVGQRPTSGNRVSGVANTIEASAIEKRLTEEFVHKAGYEGSDFPTQAKMAADVLDKGIDHARAVVRGEEQMPHGLKSGALIGAMELYAEKNPSMARDIYRELANSHLSSTISSGASETSFARMMSEHSVSQVLKRVKETLSRGEKGAKTRATEVKKMKETVTKTAAKMMDYQKILDEIKTC